MVEAKVTEKRVKIPTAGIHTVERHGFHKKTPVRSYVVVLTEIGGSRVKAVRLDEQIGWDQARQTAVEDNPGWRFKFVTPLSDRDFEEGERI